MGGGGHPFRFIATPDGIDLAAGVSVLVQAQPRYCRKILREPGPYESPNPTLTVAKTPCPVKVGSGVGGGGPHRAYSLVTPVEKSWVFAEIKRECEKLAKPKHKIASLHAV